MSVTCRMHREKINPCRLFVEKILKEEKIWVDGDVYLKTVCRAVVKRLAVVVWLD